MVMDKYEISVLLRNFLMQNQLNEAAEIIEEMHPADIVEVFDLLDPPEQEVVFKLLPPEIAAEVLFELDTKTQSMILKSLGIKKTTDILTAMASDDTADLLQEMSDEEIQKLLNLMKKEQQEEVRELLGYEEDSAGGIMTTEYVAIPRSISAEDAIQILRRTAPDAETVYYVYVVDQEGHLVGVISLRELIVAKPSEKIENIMRTNVISVNVETDQEEVANIVKKYDFLAVPVVDDFGELLGIVTVDDVIDVIEEEVTEDIYRLVGANEVEIEENSSYTKIFASVRSRLPWLLVTIAGQVVSGSIIRNFSATISAVVALAYFMPLLAGMGGNVGTQSSTIAVRRIATGKLDSKQAAGTILREAIVGSLLGVVCGVIVAVIAYVWQGLPILGLIVGIAMWVNAVTAASIGTIVPLIFKKIGVDPAVASAPFISTTIDCTGLTIYFTLATIMIQRLL
jgi:magnesium transporter